MAPEGFALLLAAGAVWMDLRDTAVDNQWIVFWLVCFLVTQCLASGPGFFKEALAGFLIPFFLLFPFFLFRMLGAGDIKLLMVLGCMQGPSAILRTLFLTFLLGAVLSLAVLLDTGLLWERIQTFSQYIRNTVQTKKRMPYLRSGVRPESLHMTVPIFLATLLWAGDLF